MYMTRNGRALMSGRLKPDGLTTEEPAKVFDLLESTDGGFPWWPDFCTVGQEGKRFLMLQEVKEESAPERAAKPNARVVLNWSEEIREKQKR